MDTGEDGWIDGQMAYTDWLDQVYVRRAARTAPMQCHS